MSWMSSAGSPKKLSPPCASNWSSWRWIVPTVARVTLPYFAERSAAFSAAHASIAWRSGRSSSSIPCSSAALKTSWSTPSCVSLSAIRRASSSGPISLIVVRTGWPAWPNRSQKITGLSPCAQSLMPISSARALNGAKLGAIGDPDMAIPARSPFTSDTKTGTPARLKPSAMPWSVTVLPVPVAPAISPWRLARLRFSSSRTPSLVAPTKMVPSLILLPQIPSTDPRGPMTRGGLQQVGGKDQKQKAARTPPKARGLSLTCPGCPRSDRCRCSAPRRCRAGSAAIRSCRPPCAPHPPPPRLPATCRSGGCRSPR